MPRLSFRQRLGLLFVATLVIVQLLTAVLIYEVTRRALVTEGELQLSTHAQAFVSQMDDISERVAANVEVISLDEALHSAIAKHDRSAVLALLQNHGRRIIASRMQWVGLDGTVQADTGDVTTGNATTPATRFPFPDLITNAYKKRTAGVVILRDKAYWIVVVPIYAPQPVGVIVVDVPLDDALLNRMQRLSGLPRDIELATQTSDGQWQVVARGNSHSEILGSLAQAHGELPWMPQLASVGGNEYIVLAQHLAQPAHSAPIAAVFGYSLDDALRPFHTVVLTGILLLALGLCLGLIGVWFVARGVSRPIETLALAVRRVEAGDYRAPPGLQRTDEIGLLSTAFGTMAEAVRQREERIRHQAMHDRVTNLPTRMAAEDAINRSISFEAELHGALLMIGLTRVPDIIKTMGHALSDRLMRDAGESIREAAAGAYLARVTDMQFMVWMADADKFDATAAALRILDTLNTPYQEKDVSIDRMPSIGVSIYPADGLRANTLLRHAEVAQFTASGSATALSFYDAATDPHRPERLSLMGDLREALDRDKLSLHYQPKLSLATLRIDGGEALVRWHHPTLGVVAPDAFIGMAEDTGNIHRVTRWALATALTQAKRWSEQGLNLTVSVNLSTRDLDDVELPTKIIALLAIHGLPPSSLTVEVTERAVIGEHDLAIQILRRLADHGVGIAIDDFGVGQSTFAYLRQLPVSELKIDQLFIKQLGTDRSDQIIVRSIIELSHRLGYTVTAEGVEDKSALDYLIAIGCDHAQGYFITRALAANDFMEFVSEANGAATSSA
jgi:diguanylate cyclase (GGDEF)-like protein